MSGRDPREPHRASTPLELFFDLTFVVAIAQAASTLHHGLVEGHASDVIPIFPLAFFAIWWAWMNFTWFASAYDTNDTVYRLAALIQMTGVLIFAAGVPRAFDGEDFGVMTLGYVVMRLAMVGQWLRAAASHPQGRKCDLRYAAGTFVVQIAWVARMGLPKGVGLAAFLVLVVVELAIPVWAEAAGRTSWHPAHIVERYGLFTIIVLGESILAATIGVQSALDDDTKFGDLALVVVGGLLIVFSMWWIYFDLPAHAVVENAQRDFGQRLSQPFIWGYGHYFVFAAAAATGAGLAVAVDQAVGETDLTDRQAVFTTTIPVVVFLLATWVLHYRYKRPGRLRTFGAPVGGLLILASSLTGAGIVLTGCVLAALVSCAVVDQALRSPAATR